jgi:hypothetical protein
MRIADRNPIATETPLIQNPKSKIENPKSKQL